MHHQSPITWLLAVTMACSVATEDAPSVRPGIEVLLTDSLHLVSGARVGLITNQTGIDQRGVADVEKMLASGVQLTALFSPEHGFRGVLDRPDIGHSIDSATGLPVYSLYGATRRPTPDMLSQIDVLVIDLQDIGARTYTYISTTLLAMRAAAAVALPVIVVDRPNPIGGVLVQGPMLDDAYASFVGLLPVPLRHGMTLGELARLGNDTLGIGAELTVVPTDGWSRHQWFDATGLPWVRPSPSLPDLESATHYPGVVLFEATNLSVGRGTPIAFQVVGAPWLKAGAVLDVMDPVPGVTISDTTVVPAAPPDGKYPGMAVRSLRLRVTDRAMYDPTATAVAMLVAIRRVHGDALEIVPERFDERAGSPALRRAVEADVAVPAIVASWNATLDAFRDARRSHLIYR